MGNGITRVTAYITGGRPSKILGNERYSGYEIYKRKIIACTFQGRAQ
jgi:hypothetical protein